LAQAAFGLKKLTQAVLSELGYQMAERKMQLVFPVRKPAKNGKPFFIAVT